MSLSKIRMAPFVSRVYPLLFVGPDMAMKN